jgi:Neuraminidase (sialidase)
LTVFKIQYYSNGKWIDMNPDINPKYKIDLSYLIGFAKGLNYFYTYLPPEEQIFVRVLKADSQTNKLITLYSYPSGSMIRKLTSKKIERR